MAETAETTRSPLAALSARWARISPRLIPLLAVLTAFLIGIPFMIFTSGGGDVAAGLRISGAAYSSLIEGATGFTINDLASPDDVALVRRLAEAAPFTQPEIGPFERTLRQASGLNREAVVRQGALLTRLDLDDDALNALGTSLPGIREIGPDTLVAMRPLIIELEALPRADVRDLAQRVARAGGLTPELRAEIETAAPAAAELADADLLAYLTIVDGRGIVSLDRYVLALADLEAAGVAVDSDEADDLIAIAATGAPAVRAMAASLTRMADAGITDIAAMLEQIGLVGRMYSANLLSDPGIATALSTEFDAAIADNLVIRRPGNRLLVINDPAVAGVRYNNADRPDNVYLHLGGRVLLFFPSNLENTLVRSMPYILAGLAVALGFKAGLFNIGAEGQLYMGATLAVWVGFSDLFSGLGLAHLPVVLLAGMIGGMLWGSIPGMLKAFTGAHEVITTIMLNFIAILLVDWLIKSTNPIILQDPTASIPRTPNMALSARLPVFSSLTLTHYLIAGAVIFGLMAFARRDRIRQDLRALLRPLIFGLLTVVGGLFLTWLAVRDALHLGLVLVLVCTWFVSWFLDRTTLGFELRTVGANPDAARYAGMSVPRNIVLAMMLSGTLAGIAGTIQIAGVQHNMQPGYFSGLGFDAIAVALLARNNPRNMIFAGLLWGALLTGAGLMQINANISIDLVRIIQAVIIMFIAADTIIRTLWRIPADRGGATLSTAFSKGWGG